MDRLKGDAKLVPSNRIVMEKEDTKHVLTIKKAVTKDAGSYSCKASNTVGTVTVSAKLTVKGEWLLLQTPAK